MSTPLQAQGRTLARLALFVAATSELTQGPTAAPALVDWLATTSVSWATRGACTRTAPPTNASMMGQGCKSAVNLHCSTRSASALFNRRRSGTFDWTYSAVGQLPIFLATPNQSKSSACAFLVSTARSALVTETLFALDQPIFRQVFVN